MSGCIIFFRWNCWRQLFKHTLWERSLRYSCLKNPIRPPISHFKFCHNYSNEKWKTNREDKPELDWRWLVPSVLPLLVITPPAGPCVSAHFYSCCIFLFSVLSPPPLFPGQISLAPWGQMRRPSWLMCRVTTTRSQASRRWEMKWNPKK